MSPPFSFTPASASDVPEIVDFLLADFVRTNASNALIGKKRDNVEKSFRKTTESSVASGTCVLVRDEHDSVIGVRLSGFEDRQDSYPPVDLSRAGKITKLLVTLNEGKWTLIPPDIDRLFQISLISIAEKYRRLGIAKALLTYGFDSIREQGAKGVFAEAITIAAQVLFAKEGYTVLREIVHKEWLDEEGKPVFDYPDGTKCAQLVFSRL